LTYVGLDTIHSLHLADFGVSKEGDSALHEFSTRAGTGGTYNVLGDSVTIPAFMAPEIMEGKYSAFKADGKICFCGIYQ
jgi:hypothetical protein